MKIGSELCILFLLLGAVVTLGHECRFSSPDDKFMIEDLPNSYKYQTARLPSGSPKLDVFLTIAGLKIYEFLRNRPQTTPPPTFGMTTTGTPLESIAGPYVRNSTRLHGGTDRSDFTNRCEDEDNGEITTCFYNGSILLSNDMSLQIIPMFFYAQWVETAVSVLCSLHVIKYNISREKLFGTFKYDEDRSENEPTLYFRFIPAVDAFPQTIYVKPTLTCLGGDYTYNLAQISTDDNVFTMERSSFQSSGDCKITIYNEKDSKELNVVLPTIQQLTTLPPITTPKDQTSTVYGLTIGIVVLFSLAIIFIILFLKQRLAQIKISAEDNQQDEDDPQTPDDFRDTKALPGPPVIGQQETIYSDLMESQVSMDAPTSHPNGYSHRGNGDISYNPQSHVNSSPKSLIGPATGHD